MREHRIALKALSKEARKKLLKVKRPKQIQRIKEEYESLYPGYKKYVLSK